MVCGAEAIMRSEQNAVKQTASSAAGSGGGGGSAVGAPLILVPSHLEPLIPQL